MSPLARIRQVATCVVFASIAVSAVAADPQANPATQSAPTAQQGAAAGAPEPAPRAQAPATGPTVIQPASTNSQPAHAAQPPAAQTKSTAPVASQLASGTLGASGQSAAAASVASEPPKAASAQAGTATAAPAAVQLAPNSTAEIAHSALLTVAATSTGDALQLNIRRVSDKSLVSSSDVTVTVDGRNEPVTHESNGSYELAINNLRGEAAHDVDITAAHDGIREILSGKVTLVQAGSADSLLRDHKQVAWWILNIVIVLIAAMAISRRKG
jgi:hypothetical protein